jgi:molecular chaperone GrpE (heat shock protein)
MTDTREDIAAGGTTRDEAALDETTRHDTSRDDTTCGEGARDVTVPETAGLPNAEALIDFARVNTELAAVVSTELAWAAPASTAGSESLLAEIAGDTVQILRRLQAIESGLAQMGARLEQIDARVDTSARALAAELASQRRELLGDRKGLLSRALFNAIVAHLDGLRAMHLGLRDAKGRIDRRDRRTADQLNAIEATLLTALQGMGFHEFHARAGEPFLPTSMECLGYVRGEQGVVLQAVRAGFKAAEGVVRPAGVYIAEPR